MIKFSALESSLIHHEQCTWALVSNLLNQEHEQTLIEKYPQQGFTKCVRDNGPKKHYSFSLNNLVLKNDFVDEANPHIDKIWYSLAKILLSNEYIDLLSNQLKIKLQNLSINIGFYKFEYGDWVSPHIDNPEKVLTQIFYFNDSWSTQWGGYFKLLNCKDSNDSRFSIPPLATFSVFIARSDFAWHMVTPIEKIAKPRLSMQLEFIRST